MKKRRWRYVLYGSIVYAAMLFGCGGEDSPGFGPVAFSPDGHEILFSYSVGRASFLFKASVQGGTASRLTKSNCKEEYAPAFSPSGGTIAFSCSGHIYLAKSDGSEVQEIVPSDGKDTFPRFSPDGEKLYFARYGYYGNYSPIAQPTAHEWNIWVINLADKQTELLTNENFYGIGELSISPDGKEMMVTTLDQGILVYSTSGGASLRKIDPPVHSASPNGGKVIADAQYLGVGNFICFMSASTGKDGFDYDVYRMNLETETLEQLTKQNGYSTELRVSPNARLAILEKWSKNWRSMPIHPVLYVLDLETKKMTKLDIAIANRNN